MTEEIEVKGIIISTAPNGEYGRRARLLTDKLGLITVFARGAAKQGSKLMGSLRPMTSAVFRLQKGKGAYNLHGIEVIDAFTELSSDFESSVYAMYVLEAGEYFSAEGMPEHEARALLNLMYVSMAALREKRLSRELIMAIYRLRLLVLQGEYTITPPHSNDDAVTELWKYCISAKLTRLYAADGYTIRNDTGSGTSDISTLRQQKPAELQRKESKAVSQAAAYEQAADKETAARKNEAAENNAAEAFIENADWLFERQVRHRFKSLEVLKGLT